MAAKPIGKVFFVCFHIAPFHYNTLCMVCLYPILVSLNDFFLYHYKPLDRRIPKNPKFQNVRSRLDTGCSMSKKIEQDEYVSTRKFDIFLI